TERAGQVIVIDHHRTNPGFGSILVLDPAASSTAELVFRLVERMGGDLPDGAAACLYAGVVTDTGRFQYEATTPETLRVAAELRRRKFDHARLGQVLFEDGFRVSLRSRGNTDVAAIAQAFGGGGHRLAAGYTSTTGLEDTALALIDALCRGRTRRADG